MASNIDIQKKCGWCGKLFIAHKTSTRCCSHRCANLAYKERTIGLCGVIYRTEYAIYDTYRHTHCSVIFTAFISSGNNNRTRKICITKILTTMNIISFEEKTFEGIAAKFEYLVQRVDNLCRRHGERKIDEWMDNHDVCHKLRISPRTLQTLRDNGTLAFSKIGNKTYYRPEDVERIIRIV